MNPALRKLETRLTCYDKEKITQWKVSPVAQPGLTKVNAVLVDLKPSAKTATNGSEESSP